MEENKKSRPVLAHHGGKGKTFIVILPLFKKTVKAAGVAVGVYIVAAIAALNVPAAVVGVLLENALIGAYMRLEA